MNNNFFELTFFVMPLNLFRFDFNTLDILDIEDILLGLLDPTSENATGTYRKLRGIKIKLIILILLDRLALGPLGFLLSVTLLPQLPLLLLLTLLLPLNAELHQQVYKLPDPHHRLEYQGHTGHKRQELEHFAHLIGPPQKHQPEIHENDAGVKHELQDYF
jgi:hypothetical protein